MGFALSESVSFREVDFLGRNSGLVVQEQKLQGGFLGGPVSSDLYLGGGGKSKARIVLWGYVDQHERFAIVPG